MTAWIALCVGGVAGWCVASAVAVAEYRRKLADEAEDFRRTIRQLSARAEQEAERYRTMKHELLAETLASPPDTAGEPPIPDVSRRTRRLVELARRGHDLACRIDAHASRPMDELPEHEAMLIHLAAAKLSDAMESLVSAARKAGTRSGF